MKKLLSYALALLTLTAVKAAPKSHIPFVVDKPYATFDSIWVDYDITENDMFGMRIHLKFSCYEMKDIDSYVAIYFEFNDAYAG